VLIIFLPINEVVVAMGIFDIFRSKKQEAEKEETYIVQVEEISTWLSEQFGKETEDAKKNARKIGVDAVDSLSTSKEKLSRLEKSTFGGKDKAFAAANMAKDSFVKRTLSIIDSSRYLGPGKETYSGLREFNSKLKSALKEINKTSPKQLFLLSRYFRNESKDFMDSLKMLEGKTKELEEFLDSNGKVIEMSERVKGYANKLNELTQKQSRLREQQRSIEEEITKLDAMKKVAKQRLEDLAKSREWKELKELEESLQKDQSQLSDLEIQSNEMLSAAKRPLKKLRHLEETRDTFPDNPFKDIVLAGREQWLSSMLKSAEEKFQEGSITLKTKEAERLEKTERLLEDKIPKIKEKYMQILEKAEEKKRNIAKFDLTDKRNEMEKEVLELDIRLKKQWSELDSRIKDDKGTGIEIDDFKQRAEKLVLDLCGKKLEIKIPTVKDDQPSKQPETMEPKI
jgi:hypothetical protein